MLRYRVSFKSFIMFLLLVPVLPTISSKQFFLVVFVLSIYNFLPSVSSCCVSVFLLFISSHQFLVVVSVLVFHSSHQILVVVSVLVYILAIYFLLLSLS